MNQQPLDPNRSYTIEEAAGYLGVSDKTVRREISDGRLTACRVRGCIRITGKEIIRYQDRARVNVWQ